MTVKQDAIEYLQDIRQHYSDYHKHKERSAWAGVALYVLFAGTLLPIQLRGPDTVWYDAGYAVFILIVGSLVFLYVRNQLDLKDEGQVYVAASVQLLSEIMAMDEDEFDSGDFFKTSNAEDSYHDSNEILPEILLNRADKFRRPTTAFTAANISKLLCYLLIIILTGGLLAARFIL